MTDDKIIVKTSSGIEALLTLIRSGTTLVLDATAVTSAATLEFDAAYERKLERWLDASARLGVLHSGTPPLSGAHVMLAEIRVTPPKELRGIGREIQGMGGTGSEWLARWTWDLSGIESVDGEVLVQTEVDAVTLLVPRSV